MNNPTYWPSEEHTAALCDACAKGLLSGVPPNDVQQMLVGNGCHPDAASEIVAGVVRTLIAAGTLDPNTLFETPPTVEHEQGYLQVMTVRALELLSEGRSLVEAFQQFHQGTQEMWPSEPSRAMFTARLLTESVGAVFDQMTRAGVPIDEDEFVDAVWADRAALETGTALSMHGALYPEVLPQQFFFAPGRFLDMCEQLGAKTLGVLWDTTEGCEGEVPSGTAHCGRLKDQRRYVVLRMPPPQFRFEAHFVAMVGNGGNQTVPPRMFAIERGCAPEEAVLVEVYHDGRLRLGRAGPAESSNFIRLVRQQLGL